MVIPYSDTRIYTMTSKLQRMLTKKETQMTMTIWKASVET